MKIQLVQILHKLPIMEKHTNTKFYSLAAIIAVGYRIDSERAYKWLIEGDVSVKGESPH
mgnify:CR=1 FL=1